MSDDNNQKPLVVLDANVLESSSFLSNHEIQMLMLSQMLSEEAEGVTLKFCRSVEKIAGKKSAMRLISDARRAWQFSDSIEFVSKRIKDNISSNTIKDLQEKLDILLKIESTQRLKINVMRAWMVYLVSCGHGLRINFKDDEYLYFDTQIASNDENFYLYHQKKEKLSRDKNPSCYYETLCDGVVWNWVPNIYASDFVIDVPVQYLASYILMMISSEQYCNAKDLEKTGLSIRRAKDIFCKARALVECVDKQAEMKVPFEFEAKKGNNVFKSLHVYEEISFWRREFVKRRFFSDVKSNESLKRKINEILYIVSTQMNRNISLNKSCKDCLFESKEKFWSIFNSLLDNYECILQDCIIKKYIILKTNKSKSFFSDNLKDANPSIVVVEDLLSEIYDEYGFVFSDLSLRISADRAFSYYKRDVLSKDDHVSFCSRKLFPGNAPDTAKLSLHANYPFKKNADDSRCINEVMSSVADVAKKSMGKIRYHEKNEVYIIGLWIWDFLHIGGKEGFSNAVFELIFKNEWCKKLSLYSKYKTDIEKKRNCRTLRGDGVFFSKIINECNGAYKIVDNFINNSSSSNE